MKSNLATVFSLVGLSLAKQLFKPHHYSNSSYSYDDWLVSVSSSDSSNLPMCTSTHNMGVGAWYDRGKQYGTVDSYDFEGSMPANFDKLDSSLVYKPLDCRFDEATFASVDSMCQKFAEENVTFILYIGDSLALNIAAQQRRFLWRDSSVPSHTECWKARHDQSAVTPIWSRFLGPCNEGFYCNGRVRISSIKVDDHRSDKLSGVYRLLFDLYHFRVTDLVDPLGPDASAVTDRQKWEWYTAHAPHNKAPLSQGTVVNLAPSVLLLGFGVWELKDDTLYNPMLAGRKLADIFKNFRLFSEMGLFPPPVMRTLDHALDYQFRPSSQSFSVDAVLRIAGRKFSDVWTGVGGTASSIGSVPTTRILVISASCPDERRKGDNPGQGAHETFLYNQHLHRAAHFHRYVLYFVFIECHF